MGRAEAVMQWYGQQVAKWPGCGLLAEGNVGDFEERGQAL
jgi:hypothetical protein